jgi:hypothetical protein
LEVKLLAFSMARANGPSGTDGSGDIIVAQFDP